MITISDKIESPRVAIPNDEVRRWQSDGYGYLTYLKKGKIRATKEIILPASLIGRHDGCDIRLPDPGVSRFHCLIYYESGCLHLRDLQSSGGTEVNDEVVQHAILADQDIVQIGPYMLRVETNLSSESLEDQRAASTQV